YQDIKLINEQAAVTTRHLDKIVKKVEELN
ncbi:ketopantoate reductase family protein, partial [Staphylococcus succinus]